VKIFGNRPEIVHPAIGNIPKPLIGTRPLMERVAEMQQKSALLHNSATEGNIAVVRDAILS
jgi:hypothetical protein